MQHATRTIQTEQTIHSIKTALACLIGLMLAKLFRLPVDQWLIITIMVVMCGQINVGSMLTKSKMRFLGTLSGSLIAGVTIAVAGINTIAVTVVIVLSTIVFSYIATNEKKYSESGPLGAVTVAIILLGQQPTLYTALHRFGEISAGIFIAAFVSQFILPIRARDHLRTMQAKALWQLKSYYELALITRSSEETLQELDEEIVKSLSQQRNLAKQSAREPFGVAFDPVTFTKLLRSEKEIFRSIVCMHYAREKLPAGKNFLDTASSIQNFHQTVLQTLQIIIDNIAQKPTVKTTLTIPSVTPFKAAVHAIRLTTSVDELVYIDGFLFCAEIIVLQLTELAILTERKFPALDFSNCPEDATRK